MTEVEAFYVEHHYETQTVEELATRLGLSVRKVKNHIKKHLAKTKGGDVKDNKFDAYKGTVSMTQAQSEQDDELPKGGPGYLEVHSNNIHKINPEKPIH